MKELRKIIVSGGGTGGHIMPAIALCEALRDKYPELKIIFAGREDSMEERLAEKRLSSATAICMPEARIPKNSG